VKLACEKCRKKFNDSMALEYHRITFHATAVSTGNSTADRDGNTKIKQTKNRDGPDIQPDNPDFLISGIWPDTAFELSDIRPNTR
jgi:hypothetical protein